MVFENYGYIGGPKKPSIHDTVIKEYWREHGEHGLYQRSSNHILAVFDPSGNKYLFSAHNFKYMLKDLTKHYLAREEFSEANSLATALVDLDENHAAPSYYFCKKGLFPLKNDYFENMDLLKCPECGAVSPCDMDECPVCGENYV